MQILGVYIYPESKRISKVLKSGWFPFGNYPKPCGDEVLIIPRIHEMIRDIYSSKGEPKISINAIVGQNGAGKSTLLELVFALINNLVIKILGAKKTNNYSRQLSHASGVYADLYFIIENVQYRICGRDLNVNLYIGKNGRFKPFPIYESECNVNLETLFYTIITNYSLYAYNTNESRESQHRQQTSNSIYGQWLDGLFHKNDGYYTPIVITPYRSHGTINIETESYLAEQRINMLSLLAAAKGKAFLDNYIPSKLLISIRHDFIEEKIKALKFIAEEKNCYLDCSMLLEHFKERWLLQIKSKYPNRKMPIASKQFKYSIFYLAYKSIKLCLNYLDYRNVLGLDNELRSLLKDNGQDMNPQYLDTKIDCIIAKILKDLEEQDNEHNHLVLKIEQVLDYLNYYFENKNFKWKNRVEIEVKTFLNKKIKRYCDIFRLMPPAFFDTQLEFVKVKNPSESSWISFNQTQTSMRLSQMSSGERHLLTCLSYVLYHIKNIESIKTDKERVKYKHICLVFDEIELYFHPDFQRRFVKMLLEALSWCNISNRAIKSMQIILVTHSPFILTDIFTHNTLYLRDGNAVKVSEETFGANYYDLLNNSFFFSKSAVGEVSTNFIKELTENTKKKQVHNLLEYVGDQMIKGYIKNHISE
ncbi:MAG: AAA family ATPase [Muribaculaceae bacterium]|nr:AAA family ATPase [Muribaculaceae bacterium]